MLPNTRNDTKIARHPAVSLRTCPIAGAMIGTRMNTDMIYDMVRAMASPEALSRTMAVAITRGPAAPKPWMARPMRSVSKSCAKAQIEAPTR